MLFPPVCFFVLPHRASPLYTLDSPTCILPRRYCTRNLLLVTVIRQVLAFTLLQALLQALLDILIVTHTRHFGALSILSCSCFKQVNNPFQMACLSDLFLLGAEIWQEACSVPMLQDRYKAYIGGGVAGYPLRRGAASKRYLYIYSDKNQEFERFSTLK